MNTRRNKYLFPVVVAFSILAIASLACGSSTPTTAPIISTATSGLNNTQSSANTAVPAVPTGTTMALATNTSVPEQYLGDAVSNYGYALTGVSVEDPATPGMLYQATSGKKLIAVDVIISNLSGDMLTVNPLNATLVDKDGYTYQVDLGGVDNQLSSVDLNPGEKVNGIIPFEVPDNAVAASIKYSINTFGSNILQANLLPAPQGHVAATEPPSTPGNPLPKLGDVVQNFGYSLSADTVDDPATPGILYTPQKGYKLVAVEIVLENVSGSEALEVNPLSAYLVDNNGFVYSTDLGGIDDQIESTNLNTGEKAKGWVAFTIPENAEPASIKYSTQTFSGNYLQTGVTK